MAVVVVELGFQAQTLCCRGLAGQEVAGVSGERPRLGQRGWSAGAIAARDEKYRNDDRARSAQHCHASSRGSGGGSAGSSGPPSPSLIAFPAGPTRRAFASLLPTTALTNRTGVAGC